MEQGIFETVDVGDKGQITHVFPASSSGMWIRYLWQAVGNSSFYEANGSNRHRAGNTAYNISELPELIDSNTILPLPHPVDLEEKHTIVRDDSNQVYRCDAELLLDDPLKKRLGTLERRV